MSITKRIILGFCFFLYFFANPLISPVTLQASGVIYQTEEEAKISEFKKFKEQINNKPGTYFLTIQYQSETGEIMTKTIAFTLKAEHTIVGVQDAIDASNVTVSVRQVKKFTADDWKKHTNARAWKLSSNETIAIPVIDTTAIKPIPGHYPLSLQTEAGTTTSVIVTVVLEEEQIIVSSVDEISEAPTLFTIMKISLSFIFLIVLMLPLGILFGQYIHMNTVINKFKKTLFEEIHRK